MKLSKLSKSLFFVASPNTIMQIRILDENKQTIFLSSAENSKDVSEVVTKFKHYCHINGKKYKLIELWCGINSYNSFLIDIVVKNK